jgi:hypothetical protein
MNFLPDKLIRYIVRVIRNVSIWEKTNFYDKNTYFTLVNIKKIKFVKSHIYRVLEASKVKSDFSTYFSKEKSYSKKVFCIINLVH